MINPIKLVDSARIKAPPAQLRSLGYTGRVVVTGGPIADRIANAIDTYLGMDPDDVLYGFRQHAGLPTPGKPMTGWAIDTTEATFGQWVSGLARLFAVTRDGRLRERVATLVDGWSETLGSDGNPHMGMYGFEKAMCGLVDAAVFADHEPAMQTLELTVGWALEHFDRRRTPAHAADFASDWPQGIEWYTLSENAYRGWLAGGADVLRRFAEEWHYDAYWRRFAARPESGAPWDVPAYLHAYSHLNTFSSAGAAYLANGDESLVDIMRHAHEYFTTTQTYATGGYGPSEFTLPDDGSLGRSIEWRTDCAEIVCGSWAAFKLSTYLLNATGEARFGDWPELLVYSGVGAVTPVHLNGRSPYYHDYRLGVATKLPHWDSWPCCSGTYVQAVAHLTDLIYFEGESSVAVNLFVPSTVNLTHLDSPVRLIQETAFPESNDSRIRVEAGAPLQFTVKLRVPAWSSEFRATVDGEVLEGRPGHWLEIDRTWSSGDVIEINLGARLRVLAIDKQHPNRVALAHGPVVLAQDAIWTMPLSLPTPWTMVDLEAAFEQSGLEYTPIQLGTARLPPGSFRPLADVPDRVPHRVYFDLDDPRII